VDDEPSVRMLASTALTRGGFRVIEAADGLEGLEALAADPHVDIVVLDLTMPALDGMEVLEAIREQHPFLPVLLSSGYSGDHLPTGTLEAGLTVFLRKPYAPSQLLAAVSDLLRTAAEPRGVPARAGGPSLSKVWRQSG
jgi:CheY-like chemotaxis protein